MPTIETSAYSLNLSLTEGSQFWTGQIESGDLAMFQNLKLKHMLAIYVGNTLYNMMVQNITVERESTQRPKLKISLVSPSALLAPPYAIASDQDWFSTEDAYSIASNAVSQAITWTLVNWYIPCGRFATHNGTPLSIVKTLAEVAGGTVETNPDGTLLVRPLFPISPPNFASCTPDFILTDASHNLKCQQSKRSKQYYNQFVVRGYQAQAQFFTIEVDNRTVGGLNGGKTVFSPGDQIWLLVYMGPGVSVVSAHCSSGAIYQGGSTYVQLEQDLYFTDVGSTAGIAFLAKPALQLLNYTWVGNSLGTLTLQPDMRTVIASTTGTAICRVAYVANAFIWQMQTPTSLVDLTYYLAGGMTSYPLQVQVNGLFDSTHDGDTLFQRYGGTLPGPDISNPLLCSDAVKLARGIAELDKYEQLQEIHITTLYQDGFMPGKMVQVHDSLFGQTFIAKITGVHHNFKPPIAQTLLDVVRYDPIG